VDAAIAARKEPNKARAAATVLEGRARAAGGSAGIGAIAAVSADLAAARSLAGRAVGCAAVAIGTSSRGCTKCKARLAARPTATA